MVRYAYAEPAKLIIVEYPTAAVTRALMRLHQSSCQKCHFQSLMVALVLPGTHLSLTSQMCLERARRNAFSFRLAAKNPTNPNLTAQTGAIAASSPTSP